MRLVKSILLLLVIFSCSGLLAQPLMDNARMAAVLEREAEKMEGETGAWMLYFSERIVLVLTDELNNRMRIFTPILEETKVTEKEMAKMLKANFHSALDAKYGFYEGFVVSLFTHPLAELSESQLVNALQQVVSLAETFGTSYSSSGLIFGGGSPQLPEEQAGEKRINQSPSKNKRSH